MAPGTGMGSATGDAAPSWPWLMLGAAASGALAGTTLAAPQWLVLRRVLPRATWWVLAHALAWSLGMLIALGGTSLIDGRTPMVAGVIVIGGGTGLARGAAVAAVTGAVLVWLLAGATARAGSGTFWPAPGTHTP